jgi:hypothetical protein
MGGVCADVVECDPMALDVGVCAGQIRTISLVKVVDE